MFRGCALCAHGDGHVTAANRLGCVCGRQRPPGRRGERRGKAPGQHAPVNDYSFEPSRPIVAPSIALASSRRAEGSPGLLSTCGWWHRRVSTRDARSMHIELAGAHACRRLMR